VLADQPAQHGLDARDRRAEVEKTRPQVLLATEGEQLAGQRRAPLAGLDDLLDLGKESRPVGQLVGDQPRVAQDCVEDVVEVVRLAVEKPRW
jgi:hypothetical protein